MRQTTLIEGIEWTEDELKAWIGDKNQIGESFIKKDNGENIR